jgi:hypothetical protein
VTTDTLDGVLIEPEDQGFHVICSGHHSEYDFFVPDSIAEELLRAAKREIEPRVLEKGSGHVDPRHSRIDAGHGYDF